EVDGLFALWRDAHAADDDVELARAQPGNDTVESRGYDNRLNIETLGDFGADIDVKADNLILAVDKAERRKNATHANAQFAALLDLFEIVGMGRCKHHQSADTSCNE